MAHLPASYRHKILQHYRASEYGSGFDALAERFAIDGGGSVIRDWYLQWDGTKESLERRAGSGRARLLSPRKAKRSILGVIQKQRRKHKAVLYTDVYTEVVKRSGVKLSLRSVQRYGRRDFKIRCRKSVKRSPQERKFTLCCCFAIRTTVPYF